MKTRNAVLAMPLALGLVACGVTGPSGADLEGRWQLVSLQQAGQPVVTAPSGASFQAEFGSDGRVSLVADCNRCGSTYQAGSGTVSVGNMACTLAYCATAPLDTQFAGLVAGATSWSLQGDELELRSAQGTLRLRR